MKPPKKDSYTGPVPVRDRPREGERTRGAVDAVHTKIAVDLQTLEFDRCEDQLRHIIGELPDATGSDCAFLARFNEDGSAVQSVIASTSVFSRCNPTVLERELLSDWPWLSKHLGPLKVVEISDTQNGPREATFEHARLAEIGIGSCLIIGFDVYGDAGGFLALANERPVEEWDANDHLLMKLL